MPSKHYRWQTRWRVDMPARSAVHESGLIVRFSAPDRYGGADGEPVNSQEWLDQAIKKHGGHNIGPMLARLMREAGQIYQETLNNERT